MIEEYINTNRRYLENANIIFKIDNEHYRIEHMNKIISFFAMLIGFLFIACSVLYLVPFLQVDNLNEFRNEIHQATTNRWADVASGTMNLLPLGSVGTPNELSFSSSVDVIYEKAYRSGFFKTDSNWFYLYFTQGASLFFFAFYKTFNQLDEKTNSIKDNAFFVLFSYFFAMVYLTSLLIFTFSSKTNFLHMLNFNLFLLGAVLFFFVFAIILKKKIISIASSKISFKYEKNKIDDIIKKQETLKNTISDLSNRIIDSSDAMKEAYEYAKNKKASKTDLDTISSLFNDFNTKKNEEKKKQKQLDKFKNILKEHNVNTHKINNS